MHRTARSTPKTVHVRHGRDTSPLAHKQRRLNNDARFIPYIPPSLPELSVTPFRFACESDSVVENNHETGSRSVSASPDPMQIVNPADRAAHSKKMLHADSHAKRKEYVAREQDDKATRDTYANRVKAYQQWWECFHQPTVIANDPSRDALPAYPITAAKAMMFLDYEASRPKRKRGSRDDSLDDNVGKWSLKGTITALEWWRLNHQSDYEGDMEALTPLRNDERIRAFERAASHNEPKRVQKAQALKAAGTNADTYTKQQLIDCSLWCLKNVPGPRQLFVGARDRAMLLLSSTIAFRGDSSRNLLWSDLFSARIPMDDISPGAELTALSVLSDNAKHNQNGRTDEHGAFRHRYVELCPIGALAILFFSYFHVLETPVPNFAPDFKTPGYGIYGYREWYGLFVFSTKTPFNEMSYDNHRDRIKLIHLSNNVHITKATHSGRPFSVKTAREHGASVDSAKALGGWSESDSFKPCYDRNLPVDAMLGAAMFNGRKPETYFLARGCLEPPAGLLDAIFPWVEREIAALEERRGANKYAEDIALWQFLHLLFWFRLVLLQDTAVLFCKHPECSIFRYAPFNTEAFRKFAADSTSRIECAEEEARCAFRDLPEQMANSLRGILAGIALKQLEDHAANVTYREELHRQVMRTHELIASNTKLRHKNKYNTTLPPPPSVSPVPPTQFTASTSPKAPEAVDLPITTLTSPAITTCTAPLPPSSLSSTSGISSVSTAFISPDLIYPLSTHPAASLSTSVASAAPAPPAHGIVPPHLLEPKEVVAWHHLTAKYSEERLRKHHWKWIPESESWLPVYEYASLKKVTDIWTEYAEGLNGYLSVRELNEGWGAKWKANNKALKSEATRRNKVVDLVHKLAKKPNWNIMLALRFLRDCYDHLTPRAFTDLLGWNKNQGFTDVLKASEAYT